MSSIDHPFRPYRLYGGRRRIVAELDGTGEIVSRFGGGRPKTRFCLTPGDTNLYGYSFNNPVNLVDPEGMDALTQDPTVRNCFYYLWKKAGYGHDERERSAWISNTNSQYHTVPWPWSATASHDKWNGPTPAGVVAQAHTHPDSKDPKPSMNGDAMNPTDDYTSNQINMPIYTISRKGIWKVDPQGHVTKEEGSNWYKGISGKTCACN